MDTPICVQCNAVLTDDTECRGHRGEVMCDECYEMEYGRYEREPEEEEEVEEAAP
jgi:hypothetical protein